MAIVSADNMMDVADEAINSVGISDLKEEYLNMLRPSVEQVRIKAQAFCNRYETDKKAIQTIGKWRSRSYKQQTFLNSGTREAFDEFQNALNAYFNQMVKVMYVYIAPETGQVTLGIIDNDVSSLIITKYGSVSYHLDNIKNVFKLEDYDSTLLDITEQSIYERWNIAKKKKHRSTWLPILWRIGSGWGGARVNNLGTIAEAYAKFYLAKYKFSSDLEQDVATYILNPDYGAASVDNASGFLVGDTSLVSNNLNVQFAVKKETASPMNLETVYQEVQAILNDFDENSLNKLWERFVNEENEKAKHNQMKPLLAQSLAKTVNELSDEYEKLLGKPIKKDIKIN